MAEENNRTPSRLSCETLTLDSFASPPPPPPPPPSMDGAVWKISSPAERRAPEVDDSADDLLDSFILVPGPRLLRSGLKETDLGDSVVRFINAGGSVIQGRDPGVCFEADSCFWGGDRIGTDEIIAEGGYCPSLYQSARYGDFCYKFEGISAGEYYVDLHFAEIVNTNGPKGIRVFDVFVQEDKILSELDIYAVVGANKPLQLVDLRVSVLDDMTITIKFEGIRGTPTVCGICIRKAPIMSASGLAKPEHLLCTHCTTDIGTSPFQNKIQNRNIAKYEKKVQELIDQCKLKSDECYQAWMSLTDTNQQLERLKMEYDKKIIQTETLEQAFERQNDKLRDVSESYNHDRNVWSVAIANLEVKVKSLKQEHAQLSQDAHECAASLPNPYKMVEAVQALVAQCEDLKVKYNEEMAKRKKLYNIVQETKGNIRVFCRCRPLSKEETSSGHTSVIDFDAAKDGDIGIITGGSTKKIFKFDRVYTPKDNQVDVYADTSPFVTSVLDGYNVCIFAYGQTGTGKTFTMEGTEQSRGVNYRTLEELFKIAEQRKEAFTYNITVSVLEVYNEQIRDLLGISPSAKKLEIRQAAEGFHHVPGLVEAKVESIKEVWDVLQAGSSARAVGSNNVNEHSSRSHCMLCIMVRSTNLIDGQCTKSKLWLVDLAGSERLAKTDVQGERLKEAQNINRSLSALGDVIYALAAKSSHIPYRNSKLTHLLQDSLGGDSKALMFLQISPSDNDLGETLSSLNFASRVRGVELGPAKKQTDTGELQKTKQTLERVRQECKNKDETIRKLEDNCHHFDKQIRGKEQLCRSLEDKNKQLEVQLESSIKLQNVSERQHVQLLETMKVKEEACFALQQKVKELESKLKDQKQSEHHVFEEKVKELEFKLKKQLQSETMHLQKVKELESKLKEKLHSESVLDQKVKDLETKLREERERSDSLLFTNSADLTRIATPMEVKPSCWSDETTSEIDLQVLRSSNCMNKPITSQGSILLKGADPLHEAKRRREQRSSSLGGDRENNGGISVIGSSERTMRTVQLNRTKKIDTTKAFGRLTRTTKAVVVPQRIFQHGKSSKDQLAGGPKEKDKLKIWSR